MGVSCFCSGFELPRLLETELFLFSRQNIIPLDSVMIFEVIFGAVSMSVREEA